MIDFQKIVRAVLLSGAALALTMPIHASTIWAFSENVQTIGQGTQGTNSYAQYSSNSQFPPAGESYTYGDDTASAGFSSNMTNLNQYQGTVSLSADLGSGSVSADMSTGVTHVESSSESENYSPNFYSNVQSAINEQDQLTFSVAGGGSAVVTVGFTLDGSESPGPPNWTAWENQINFNFGANTFGYEGSWNTPGYSPFGTGGNWDSYTFNNISPTAVNFIATFTVTDGEVFGYNFTQDLECNNGDTCDFENTSQISLSLPTGVSYISASGIFLANQSSVPEPASFLIAGLGIFALGFLRRRFTR